MGIGHETDRSGGMLTRFGIIGKAFYLFLPNGMLSAPFPVRISPIQNVCIQYKKFIPRIYKTEGNGSFWSVGYLWLTHTEKYEKYDQNIENPPFYPFYRDEEETFCTGQKRFILERCEQGSGDTAFRMLSVLVKIGKRPSVPG